MTARVEPARVALTADPATEHGPTRALLLALHSNGWVVNWRQGGTAVLSHAQFGSLELEVDADNPDRVTALVDGRQVPMRVAMQRARGEV